MIKRSIFLHTRCPGIFPEETDRFETLYSVPHVGKACKQRRCTATSQIFRIAAPHCYVTDPSFVIRSQTFAQRDYY